MNRALRRLFPWLYGPEDPPALETFHVDGCELEVAEGPLDRLAETADAHKRVVVILQAADVLRCRGLVAAYCDEDIVAGAWIPQDPLAMTLSGASLLQISASASMSFDALVLRRKFDAHVEIPQLDALALAGWPRETARPLLLALQTMLEDSRAWLARPRVEVALEHLDELEEALATGTDIPEPMQAHMRSVQRDLNRFLLLRGKHSKA